MYYPTHIADDESSIESNCSAEIEGSAYLPQHLDNNGTPEKRRQHPWEKREEYGLAVQEDFDHASTERGRAESQAGSVVDQQMNQMTELIQSERNRRLGVSVNNDTLDGKEVDEGAAAVPEKEPGGLLGNIKGWFGGGNMNQSERSLGQSDRSLSNSARSLNQEPPSINASRRESTYETIHEDKAYTDDDSSSSSSSASSDSFMSNHSRLDQRTRARHQALRYLSNSCVDAGRKSKTLSYIWGLERLDLKRRRDRFERELGVVEGEMNKDWSRGGDDKVAKMAARLVRELPRFSLSGADAGAGSEKGSETFSRAFITLDEYVDIIQMLDTNISIDFEENEKNHPSKLLWTNKEALERYLASLQSRLRGAIERTKSLEKRLVVLEKTGDEIVGSLCEDLVDVTSHSNKAEARYVKKGKELERKRRRLELSYRTKAKELEKRVNLLEAGILTRSGSNLTTYLDDTSGSDDEEDNEEDDEVRLEKKLSDIKAKMEQEKIEHEFSVQSIRRQCEQSKLKLSVARLVMSGDDNLREYITALDKFDPSAQHRAQRRSSYQIDEEIPLEALPPTPPSKVTRCRAKLLKAMHLEWIYEHRLAVSKAFNDAAINALEQELVDRETAGQQMEVRCLNELMVIDSEIKSIIAKGDKKIEVLQQEVREMQDTMVVVSSDSIISRNGSDASAVREHLDNFEFEPALESAMSTDNGSSSTDANNDTTEPARVEADASAVSSTSGKQNQASQKSLALDFAQVNFYDSSTTSKAESESEIKDLGQTNVDGTWESADTRESSVDVNDYPSMESENKLKRTNSIDEEAHLGDININTPIEVAGDEEVVPRQCNVNSALNKAGEVEVSRSIPNAMSIQVERAKSANDRKELSAEHKEKVLSILGQELKCTLAEYQTSLGISSSKDRVEQLDYMNQVVVKIAEVSGIDMARSEIEGGIKSWSYTLIETKSTSRERKEKKRSKKRFSKPKRKSKRKSINLDDGFTKKEREFIASLSSAKFNNDN